ncbi:MAG: CDP-glycerol glycerophosphotransferase family protein [Eubacterium sp.]|nr:CDP-glycerol glycerophosphotransferase family protein [Eubacterium sp.]
MANGNISIIIKNDRDAFIEEFNEFLDTHKTGYLLVVSPKDTFKKEKEGIDAAWEMAEELADVLDENESAVLATPKRFFQFPDRICGVMIRLQSVAELEEESGERIRLKKSLTYSCEADFLLRLIDGRQFIAEAGPEYVQGDPGDGNFREFEGIYDKTWYTSDMVQHLIPMLTEYRSKGEIPYYIQFYAMYYITCRLDANKNNANRHVLSGEQIDKFKNRVAEALQFIDDDIIMNAYRFPVYARDYQFSRMLLRIKYATSKLGAEQGIRYMGFDSEEAARNHMGEDSDEFHHTIGVNYPALFIMKDNVPIYSSSRLRCNIQFMEYKNGKLEIDGSFPDIFDKEEIKYYFKFCGKRYEPVWCERYSLTKFFGESAYKRYPFHVSLPIDSEEAGDKTIKFCIEYAGNEYGIAFEFKSHTSRLAAYPVNTYWHFGDYLALTEQMVTSRGGKIVTGIKIVSYSWPKMAMKELGMGYELLSSFQMHRFRFFLLRAAWVLTRPYFSKKNIWMFFDKIYKGGDSSEYLYKYAEKMLSEKSADNKSNKSPDKLYYLLDEASSDYRRLKEEGYKPLKRGSFLHRLVFLNADMMIVSNSTVFAFNDYYLENSRYIRGIVDFHTVCVQHGLSVQKIALAQQRLRDNTRLYFCASKYEIENLLHPVYDYEGYDALKLTGVPRYDGLENRDKKQIMISPTWRMQSAMLVSKNEGVERDYNPFFKDTDYFKVYNLLINDKKLIEAAENYGYRIAYVLHPIVSPQAKDFDSNDYVDIIPSVGDMSYEKMFCESSLMVTDYSGIQFDFAYMRKPLVYYHPEELEAHYEEGTFHYDTMAFGEIVRKKDELVSLLIDYMKNGCEMKEIYRMRADDFFEYDDRNNCQRIYDEMIRYQEDLAEESKKLYTVKESIYG